MKSLMTLATLLAVLTLTTACAFAQEGTDRPAGPPAGAPTAAPQQGDDHPMPPAANDDADNLPQPPFGGPQMGGRRGGPGRASQFGENKALIPAEFQRMGGMMFILDRMTDAMFSPEQAGLIAIGAIKDEIPLKPAEKIEMLEKQLAATKTLGLRNALHIALKDLYKAQGQNQKAIDQMLNLLTENDQALQKEAAEDAAKAAKK